MHRRFSVLAVIVIAMTLSSIAHAQIEKGKFVVGGDIHYNQSNSSEGKQQNSKSHTRSTNINTKIGIMLSDRLEVGIQGGYNNYFNKSSSYYAHSNYETSYLSKTNTLYAGPYTRLYQPIFDKLYFFAEVSSYYALNKEERNRENTNAGVTDRYEEEKKYSSISGNLKPGLAYFLSKKFAMELTVGGLSYNKYFNKESYDKADLNLDLGFNSLRLGAKFFL